MNVAAMASGIFVGSVRSASSQRLKPRLFRDLRLGAALRLIRQIDVFEPRLQIRRHDLRFERVVELALLAYAAKDRGAALLKLAQIPQPLFQRAELRVIEHPGDFLAVARDEGHRRAAVQKLDRRLHLLRAHAKLFRNPLFDGFHLLPLRMYGAARAGRLESRGDHSQAAAGFNDERAAQAGGHQTVMGEVWDWRGRTTNVAMGRERRSGLRNLWLLLLNYPPSRQPAP